MLNADFAIAESQRSKPRVKVEKLNGPSPLRYEPRSLIVMENIASHNGGVEKERSRVYEASDLWGAVSGALAQVRYRMNA